MVENPVKPEKKIKKALGLGFLSATFIFYFLPDLTIIDLTPDIIGYILAIAGITMLADMCDELASAKRLLSYMVIVGAVKLMAVIFIFSMRDSSNETPTLILGCAFVFALCECLLLIPATIKLFDGLLYLGTRYGGTAVFSGKGGKPAKRSASDRIKRTTVTFILVKNILNVLAEFVVLQIDDDLGAYKFNNYDNINYYRFLSMLTVLIFGIIWLCKIEKYFKSLKNDKEYMDALTEKYRAEVLPNTGLFFRRRAFLALLLLSVGAVFAIDIYFGGNDGISIMPDFICALLLLAGIFVLYAKNSLERNLAAAFTAAYGILTVVTWRLNYEFSYRYTAVDVSRKDSTHSFWIALTLLAVFEAVMFVLMVFFICRMLRKTVREDTGYIPSHATVDPMTRTTEEQRKMNGWLTAAEIISVLAAAGGPFRIYMFTSSSFFADISWIIESALTGLFVIVFIRALLLIKDGINEKIQMS